MTEEKMPENKASTTRPRIGLLARIRNYFLTGLVIAAPIAITIYLAWTFVEFVDDWVKPIIPEQYNPDNYLPFSVPGVGIIFIVLFLILLGFVTANFVGRTIVSYAEGVVNGMPLVRNVYGAVKQIFETVVSDSNNSFQHAAVIEYPRKGLWAIVFVSTEARGEIVERINIDEPVSVFLPTTPNPTSGFLLFVPKKDLTLLEMGVEEAAKLVISAGLVVPEYPPKPKPENGSKHSE